MVMLNEGELEPATAAGPRKPAERISVSEWAERQGEEIAQAVKGLTQGERVDLAAGLRAMRDIDAMKARADKLRSQLRAADAELVEAGRAIGRFDELVKRVEAFTGKKAQGGPCMAPCEPPA